MAVVSEQVAHPDLVDGAETTLHSHAGGAGIPAGIICMWSGLLANIPSGWALCDGAGGRPNLRSKFIKGAAPDIEPGDTGGAATHDHDSHAALSHSGAAVDAHSGAAVANHVVTQPGDHAAQSHSGGAVDAHSGMAVGDHTNVTVPATGAAAVKIGTAGATGAANTHTHTIASIVHSVTQAVAHVFTQPNQHPALSHAGAAVDAHQVTQPANHVVTQPSDHAAQSHSSESNEPEYYTLAFIIKT